ncbi:hypothetical protein C0993_008929 [Termitomyces sp. T159_Od127]|nr:hypothetical protein C0993_008929 [Termitomyces sp. T159_Od127]
MLRARLLPSPFRTPFHCRHASSARRPSTRWTVGLFSGGALLAAALVSLPPIRAEAAPADPTTDMTLGELARAYAVFTLCSFPTLVDNSPRLLQLATAPGIRWVGERFVRWTFFDQVSTREWGTTRIWIFVGGETAEKTLPLLYKLRAVNKGALFAYSVEVDESEATGSPSATKAPSPHKRIVDEMIHCVDVAADFEDGVAGKQHTGRRTWVAIKMSALLPDANILVRFSSHLLTTRPDRSIAYPGCPHPSDLDALANPAAAALNAHDLAALRDLHADLARICARAQERGVRIIVDAEYSWYQPAIDALTLSLSRRFNKPPARADKGQHAAAVQPLVTPALLAQALADAKAGGYALGVKLVRGAYHPHEVAAHKARVARAPSLLLSSSSEPEEEEEPEGAHVWLAKRETDACYDACVRVLVRAVREDVRASAGAGGDARAPRLGVLFGTHNWASCDVILGELVRSGLAARGGAGGELVVVPDEVAERVAIGQLYGMCDDLTNYLVNKTACATPLIINVVGFFPGDAVPEPPGDRE